MSARLLAHVSVLDEAFAPVSRPSVVTERTLLVTRIRTIKNVDISIPNASVSEQQIINYSSSAHKSAV